MKNLYLGELIEKDNLSFESKNLILSPVGSGKSHFIMRDLVDKYEGKRLMLVSTTSLKESFANDDIVKTSTELRKNGFSEAGKDIHIMTYSEFGNRIKWQNWNNNFVREYSVIFCDEIHSLFDYYMKHTSVGLAAAIRYLFIDGGKSDIYYFTATSEKIDKFANMENLDIYGGLNIVNYLEDERIMRYFTTTEEKFYGLSGLEEVIMKIKDMKKLGEKGLIFNSRIDGMKRVRELLSTKGLTSIEIWSSNNLDNPMNEEQLAVREILLRDGMIPDRYDFVIINGSMREGWNLLDSRVKFAVMNTTDNTDIIQAVGRIRNNLSHTYIRALEGSNPVEDLIMAKERRLKIISSLIGEELTTEMKKDLEAKFNIRNPENNRTVKWTSIKETLEKNGYKIEDKKRNIDGKQVRFSVITFPSVQSEPSKQKTTDKVKASDFLRRLGQTKFAEVNREFLSNYIKKDSKIAYSHIKTSYNALVTGEKWEERDFRDATYLLAADKKLFTQENYRKVDLASKTTEEILEQRAKYEEAAKEELEKASKEQDEDLLAYIKANGGI